MRISDWSSDVCSSDLRQQRQAEEEREQREAAQRQQKAREQEQAEERRQAEHAAPEKQASNPSAEARAPEGGFHGLTKGLPYPVRGDVQGRFGPTRPDGGLLRCVVLGAPAGTPEMGRSSVREGVCP